MIAASAGEGMARSVTQRSFPVDSATRTVTGEGIGDIGRVAYSPGTREPFGVL